MNLHKLRQYDGCAVYADIAPYIIICLQDAGAVANSIYRGDDAAFILHRHGKHTQQELIDLGFPANPVNQTTHCLRNDGRAYPEWPATAHIPWWCQGIDVNDDKVSAVIRAAAGHGWHLFQPYPGTVEFHHLNFIHQPKPTLHTLHRIWQIRKTLPLQ